MSKTNERYPAASTVKRHGKTYGRKRDQRRDKKAAPVKDELAGPMRSHKSASWRPLFLLIVMVLCAGTLFSRLVFWQVMQHGHLAAQAAEEHAAMYAQPAMRGRIFDAHGNPLAADVSMNLVYGVPKQIRDPVRTASQLAPILHQPAKQLEGALGHTSGEVLLAPRVNISTSQKLRELALHGIVLVPQIRRDYPEGRVASQIVGFVTNDNRGFYGLEGYFDPLLTGKASLKNALRGTVQRDERVSAQSATPSQDGADLHLSIDGVVQGIAEDLLHKAVKLHGASGGTIIVMNPHTGYVLANANQPSFDPNRYWKDDKAAYVNPAAGYLYEPGSTYKIVTMAAGLDTHAITPMTAFEDNGVFTVGNDVLRNWSGGGFGWETMTEVLQHSANVGAAWVAQRLGVDRFYNYVKKFGFGRQTGIEQQGEQPGLVPMPGHKNWTMVNLYTNSFGQGIAVTPMQMIRAVGAVANGGILMKPQLVKEIVYRGHRINRRPVIQGRVISRRAAHTLTGMLVRSAIDGEASQALVHGYNIAAKTGTSNIPGPNGGYVHGATIASIVGYAPAFHPKFVALVMLNHPRDTPWGSEAAGPVLHQLFQELFMYYHIAPLSNALY